MSERVALPSQKHGFHQPASRWIHRPFKRLSARIPAHSLAADLIKNLTTEPRGRLVRLAIVLAGVVFGQAVIYGPSLSGAKVLLPLDILAQPQVYLPRTPEIASIVAKNPNATDLLYLMEPAWRFAARELRAGRLPLWAPYEYGGVPCITPKFSPFLLLQFLTESPTVIAWAQLAAAIVAGLGAYAFFRQALGVSFWPAILCAWCYPLTGFFVFWQGFTTGLPVYWLPWILLAVHQSVRRTSLWGPVWLSTATCLVLVSGHLDVAGQVLLTAGLYGLWCLFVPAGAGAPGELVSTWKQGALKLATGFALGFLLAGPYWLPVVDYTRTGSRMARRSTGEEERPPIGLTALPQVVLPDLYGAMQTGSFRYAHDHQAESSAAAYAGVLVTLVAAPLAFCSRKHRRDNVFWVLLTALSLSWCLNVPGLVQILRLPGLNMLSHNRWVFCGSFSLLALAAVGLDVMRQGPIPWRWWLWFPAAILAALCVWCLYRSTHLPEPLATQLVKLVQQGGEARWVHDLEGVGHARASFIRYHTAAAIWCGLGVLLWWSIRKTLLRQAWQMPVFAGLLMGDLLSFGYGRSAQCPRELYFPTIPVLEQVAKATPGRVMGFGCLPANLASLCGLWDIRGYDGVDPQRMTELLLAAADPGSAKPNYAPTLQLAPKGIINEAGQIQLLPVLNMLGVRYVILRGSPPPSARPLFQGTDYWVLTNAAALPRAFVPHRVEVVAEAKARLEKLTSPQFDPREVALLESPADLPPACRGSAEIQQEVPTRLTMALRMDSPGLVVLADNWDHGWKAYLNGRITPIVRANHTLRGVVAPAGLGILEFRYEPASFTWGLTLTALAGVWIAIWSLKIARAHRTQSIQKASPRDVQNGASLPSK